MALLNLKESLQEVTEEARISELTDGVLLIDGEYTLLIVHSWSSTGPADQRGYGSQLHEIRNEFSAVDYVLVSIEGTVLAIQGTRSNFDISYLPEYVGGIQLPEFAPIVRSIYHDTLRTEPLPETYLSEIERNDAIELLKSAYSANLTTYYTPKNVAQIAANWVSAGERASLIDITTGSGELLIAGVDEIEEASQVWGVDNNGLACGITQARSGEMGVPANHILCSDFFEIVEDANADPQQTFDQCTPETDISQFPEEGFDCVLGHPPIGRMDSQSSADQPNQRISEIRRLEHQFVRGGCRILNESGRGCFILPSHGLRNLRKNVLPEGVQLQRLVKLPESAFSVIGVEPMMVCVERTEEDDDLGLVNFSRFGGVNEMCGAVHAPSSAERHDFAEGTTVDRQLPSTTIQTLLSAPGAAPLFTQQYPTLEEVTQNIATGMVTGQNRIFYFQESERTESDISDEFFTPVIKELPADKSEITDRDIGWYLFDLREFVDENGLDEENFEEVSEALSSIDTAAASYVSETLAPAVENQSRRRGVLPRSIPMVNPDLVTGAITSPVKWYSVNVDADEILYNNSVVGIKCEAQYSPNALQILLNTPLYQRLSDNQFPNLDAEYVRVQIRPLERLPIILPRLSDETFDRLSSLSPYDTHESRTTARAAILQGLEESDRSTVSATYEAVSPLSKLEGYSDEVERLRSVLAGDGTIFELVDENMIRQLEKTFRTADLFETREQLIEELLLVYSEDRYWSFMGGTASQFEGILQDYVENTGGDVAYRENEEGNSVLKFRYRGDWKPLRLKLLIDEFFSGDLWEVMQDVRKKRNEIAHGRLLNDPETNAETLLLAFFVFTYAMLHEYNNYLGAEKVSR